MADGQGKPSKGQYVDYYTKEYSAPEYSLLDCKKYLMGEFRRIYAYDIMDILQFHKGQYAKAHHSLTQAINEFCKIQPEFSNEADRTRRTCPKIELTIQNDDGQVATFSLGGMASLRPKPKLPRIPKSLMKEINFVKEERKKFSQINEEEDRRFALSLMKEDYEKENQGIECSCCFEDCIFENMTQCMEGHLVCINCLNAYIKELIYGSGKVTLNCMACDCSSSYPQSEIRRCLPSATWDKLEERIMMENINCARVEDLIKCPHCDFAAILSPTVQAFACQRDSCQKITCRHCSSDWQGHEGRSCSEVEKWEEADLRKQYEERMTQAKVRTCISCKARFTKEDGCNKMTCRCGATMCYICRKSKITYNHFCRHPLDPGCPCSKCTACSLWTNPEEDEERAIEEMKKEAQEKRKAMGFEDEKTIGASPTLKTPKHAKKEGGRVYLGEGQNLFVVEEENIVEEV